MHQSSKAGLYSPAFFCINECRLRCSSLPRLSQHEKVRAILISMETQAMTSMSVDTRGATSAATGAVVAALGSAGAGAGVTPAKGPDPRTMKMVDG